MPRHVFQIYDGGTHWYAAETGPEALRMLQTDSGPGEVSDDAELALMGFLRVESGEDGQGRPRNEYQVAPGAKVHVKKA